MWASLILGFAALALICLLAGGTPAAWGFALLTALFPIALLGLARRTIKKAALLLLGILFLAPAAGLILLESLAPESVEGRFAAVALLMMIGFWLLPFVTTTLLYSRTFSKTETVEGRPPTSPTGGKDS